VHQLGAQIPWKHNCVLLDRVKDAATRVFYIRKTVEHGWSRSVLIHQLDTNLHKRLGKAPSNFALTLSSPQSDLAREILKDSYIFKPAPLVKTPQDSPTIGIILCKGKNKTVVEYTLRDAKSPIGVAEYRLLPPNLKTKLPPVSQLKDAVRGVRDH
jgi:hypothetical protein